MRVRVMFMLSAGAVVLAIAAPLAAAADGYFAIAPPPAWWFGPIAGAGGWNVGVEGCPESVEPLYTDGAFPSR